MLNLLLDLKDEFGLTYIFITHDLNVVRFISDRVLVMYLGKVAEIGEAEAVFEAARHPYTAALLASMPSLDPDRRTEQAPLGRRSAEPHQPAFRLPLPHPLRLRRGGLREKEPALYETGGLHRAACLMVPPNSGHSRAPTTEVAA